MQHNGAPGHLPELQAPVICTAFPALPPALMGTRLKVSDSIPFYVNPFLHYQENGGSIRKMAAIRTPDVTYVNSFLQYQENGGHANS
jgi:hypothetical protein